MNLEKTKPMAVGERASTGRLSTDGNHLENVEQFSQHDIRFGQHEGSADKVGKGDNGAEGLGESLNE